MPIVLKRDGFPHLRHLHRRAVIDAIHGTSFTSTEATPLSNDPRDITSSVQGAQAELNNFFVLGTGLFVLLILGYLSRRQFRSSLSRLVHALSTPSQYIQIHLHTVHYSRLQDQDTITSPIESEEGNVDLESAVRANEQEPAPPYTPQPAQVTSMRERRSKKSLHITVPIVQSTRIEENPPAPHIEAESSTPSSGSTSSNVQTAQGLASRARSLSNAGVLLASPVASRVDAYFRPYRHVPIQPHQDGGKNACLSNVSNRTESLMSTGSPCATPPPQYTITIHSSHRLTTCDSTGRPAAVPDIVLSPVPWLPREHLPQSPPHYLAIPARKSRSRNQRAKVDPKKLLPGLPEKKPSKKPKTTEVKVRHVFSSPSASPVSIAAPPSNLISASSSIPKVSKPKQQLVRSATFPPQKRAMPALPPPRPVLPLDLEAVYPTEEETTATTETIMFGGERSQPWRWPTWPNTAPVDRRFSRTENQVRRASYGVEKAVYGEKTDWKSTGDSTSDSDDVPLAQELLMAMKKRKMAIEMKVGHARDSPAFEVPRALRKGLFSGLSTLAAKARMVIERELDSDEEIEEEPIRVEREVRHRNFVARELDAASTFVIGEED